jgi:Thrombospondin type 3 repeat
MINRPVALATLLLFTCSSAARGDVIEVAVTGTVYRVDNGSLLLPISSAQVGDPMTIVYEIDDQAPVEGSFPGGVNYGPAFLSMTVYVGGAEFRVPLPATPLDGSNVHSVLNDEEAAPGQFRDRLEYTLAAPFEDRRVFAQISLMALGSTPSPILDSLERVPVPSMFNQFPFQFITLGAFVPGGGFDDITATVESVIVIARDADGDGVSDSVDNCPSRSNNAQSDVDADGAGDVCDVCPALASAECVASGSTAAELPARQSAQLVPTDGLSVLSVDSNSLGAPATLSITRATVQGNTVSLLRGSAGGTGVALVTTFLGPKGLSVGGTASFLVSANVGSLTAAQRTRVDLYRPIDVTGDGQDDGLAPLSAACSPGQAQGASFAVQCTVLLDRLSTVALVAPADADRDGVFDSYDGGVDRCPGSMADSPVNSAGCSATQLFAQLQQVTADPAVSRGLRDRAARAKARFDAGRLPAACSELEDFIDAVQDQRDARRLTPALARELISTARAIRALICVADD